MAAAAAAAAEAAHRKSTSTGCRSSRTAATRWCKACRPQVFAEANALTLPRSLHHPDRDTATPPASTLLFLLAQFSSARGRRPWWACSACGERLARPSAACRRPSSLPPSALTLPAAPVSVRLATRQLEVLTLKVCDLPPLLPIRPIVTCCDRRLRPKQPLPSCLRSRSSTAGQMRLFKCKRSILALEASQRVLGSG